MGVQAKTYIEIMERERERDRQRERERTPHVQEISRLIKHILRIVDVLTLYETDLSLNSAAITVWA